MQPIDGVSLEEFSALRARLDAGQRRPLVLRQANLDPDRWDDIEEAWQQHLVDALERGDHATLRAFEAAYEAERARHRAS